MLYFCEPRASASLRFSRKIFEARQARSASGRSGNADSFLGGASGAMKPDRETLTAALRAHEAEAFDWVERIWKLLSASADESLDTRHEDDDGMKQPLQKLEMHAGAWSTVAAKAPFNAVFSVSLQDSTHCESLRGCNESVNYYLLIGA